MEKLGTILSLLSVGLVATLLSILLWRRLAHKFPLFFIYVISSLFSSILRFSASGNYQLYFKIFWATEALYALLALLALYEAFRQVFILDYETWPWFWAVFPGTVLILCVIFVGHALLNQPAGAPRIIAVILSFETVVNFVKGGLFLMFFVLAWLLLGENWPTYPYGVVLGFAVSSAGSLLAYWLFSVFGTKLNWLGKYGPPVSYILAVLIWIASCFFPPEPKDRWRNFEDPEKALATVRQYLLALKRIAGKER
jgi:hypothetical protein